MAVSHPPTSMRVRRRRRAASRTGCFPSPSRSTTEGMRALKWSFRWSPERTAAEARAWSAAWETLKLVLSLRRSMQQSTRDVTSDDERLFLEASRNWWRRSTPAIRSFVSFARAISSASSIDSIERFGFFFLDGKRRRRRRRRRSLR